MYSIYNKNQDIIDKQLELALSKQLDDQIDKQNQDELDQQRDNDEDDEQIRDALEQQFELALSKQLDDQIDKQNQDELDQQIRDALDKQLELALSKQRDEVSKQLDEQRQDALDKQLDDQIYKQNQDARDKQIRDALDKQLELALSKQLDEQRQDALDKQLDDQIDKQNQDELDQQFQDEIHVEIYQDDESWLRGLDTIRRHLSFGNPIIDPYLEFLLNCPSKGSTLNKKAKAKNKANSRAKHKKKNPHKDVRRCNFSNASLYKLRAQREKMEEEEALKQYHFEDFLDVLIDKTWPDFLKREREKTPEERGKTDYELERIEEEETLKQYHFEDFLDVLIDKTWPDFLKKERERMEEEREKKERMEEEREKKGEVEASEELEKKGEVEDEFDADDEFDPDDDLLECLQQNAKLDAGQKAYIMSQSINGKLWLIINEQGLMEYLERYKEMMIEKQMPKLIKTTLYRLSWGEVSDEFYDFILERGKYSKEGVQKRPKQIPYKQRYFVNPHITKVYIEEILMILHVYKIGIKRKLISKVVNNTVKRLNSYYNDLEFKITLLINQGNKLDYADQVSTRKARELRFMVKLQQNKIKDLLEEFDKTILADSQSEGVLKLDFIKKFQSRFYSYIIYMVVKNFIILQIRLEIFHRFNKTRKFKTKAEYRSLKRLKVGKYKDEIYDSITKNFQKHDALLKMHHKIINQTNNKRS